MIYGIYRSSWPRSQRRSTNYPGCWVFKYISKLLEKRACVHFARKSKQFNIMNLPSAFIKPTSFCKRKWKAILEPQLLQAVDDAYLIAKLRLGLGGLRAALSPSTGSEVHSEYFDTWWRSLIPYLKSSRPEYLDWMYHYQSLVGEIQDAEMFMETLADFSSATSVSDPEPIRRYYDRRHTKPSPPTSKKWTSSISSGVPHLTNLFPGIKPNENLPDPPWQRRQRGNCQL